MERIIQMNMAGYPPARTSYLDPSPVLDELRLHNPVSRVTLPKGELAWLVTRHADVCAVLRDRRFSSDSARPDFPSLQNQEPTGAPGMVKMDDPRHGEIRRMFIPEFLAEPMKRLRPEVQRIVDGQIDHILGQTPPVDLVPVFAQAVPSRVVCRMLGIPPEDQGVFQQAVAILDTRASTDEEFHRADAELLDYADGLVTRNQREPADNLVGHLVTNQLRRGTIRRDELVAQVRVLMMAGHLTTSNMIALSVVSLLHEPERFRSIAERPEIIDRTVNEMLRYHTVSQDGLVRKATEDVVIGGMLIRAGENVLVSLASANRDGEVFTDPDTLNLERDARAHVAFGHGPHLCVGRPAALAEMEIALLTLARRVPNLRLAVPFDQIRFRTDRYIYGVHELPVAW